MSLLKPTAGDGYTQLGVVEAGAGQGPDTLERHAPIVTAPAEPRLVVPAAEDVLLEQDQTLR